MDSPERSPERESTYKFKSSRVVLRSGSILDAYEQYIAHQCNCTTTTATAFGLNASVFHAFPWADVYRNRNRSSSEDMMGAIIVRGNGEDKRWVIAMMGQIHPGEPKYPKSQRDGYGVRQRYFADALEEIARIGGLRSVAFPWGIGCGTARGDWRAYARMINDFAEKHEVTVALYKWH